MTLKVTPNDKGNPPGKLAERFVDLQLGLRRGSIVRLAVGVRID
jgi:hypothetical protein